MPHRPPAADGRRVVRLLLAGGGPLRARVRAMLAPDAGIAIVGEAGTDDETLVITHEARPHVVLIDCDDGFHVLATAKRLFAEPELDGIEVLLLGAFERDEQVLAAWRSGIGGLVQRDVAADDLARAVRMSASGAAFVVPPNKRHRRPPGDART